MTKNTNIGIAVDRCIKCPSIANGFLLLRTIHECKAEECVNPLIIGSLYALMQNNPDEGIYHATFMAYELRRLGFDVCPVEWFDFYKEDIAKELDDENCQSENTDEKSQSECECGSCQSKSEEKSEEKSNGNSDNPTMTREELFNFICKMIGG